jgi:hypothetical protein
MRRFSIANYSKLPSGVRLRFPMALELSSSKMHNFHLGEIQRFWYPRYTVQRIDSMKLSLSTDPGWISRA